MKNNNKTWIEQEDNFLLQQMSLGLAAKQIYERYGEMIGRTEHAIANRISYLKKPVSERVKEEQNSDNELVDSIDRVCNRLDTIIRALGDIKEQVQENTQAIASLEERNDQQCNAYTKALYEIKTSVVESASNTQFIKNVASRASHKMRW